MSQSDVDINRFRRNPVELAVREAVRERDMAAIGLIADIDREVAALEPEVAVAADGRLIATPVHAWAGHLADLTTMFDEQACLHRVDTVAQAALAAATGFACAASAIVFARGEARRLADAVAVGRAGLVTATVEAAILPGLTAIARYADAIADLRIRADALVRG
jgi:hypothetical protein